MQLNAPRGGLKRAMAEQVMKVMGRRIPTTVPEISPERAEHLKESLQPGDIILTCDCTFPGWARLEYWTVQASYTHAALYAQDGKVYEATGRGVKGVELEDYFSGRLKVALVRPPYEGPEDIKAASDYCQSQEGKAYDGLGDLHDDTEVACTELVYKALLAGPHPIDTRVHKVLGQETVGPDSFMKIPGARVVHDDGSHYWKNKLGHWPLAASAVGGAVAGGALAGGGGAVAGFALGLVSSVLVGNKLQTGSYWPA
ncbi:MAG: hypothetical protein AMXMBFR33_08150 [Candidatus Xenobia bacterium]